MSHFAYVMTSYGIAAAALAITISWILIDQRIQKNALKRLEAQGVRRRSDKASGSAQ
ncbi:heme exporter protein CcmD [Ochrobactrum sp. Marseille-Q0166]|uniref:heme exporter protein CcmD n=1 Tax=Ochrobactrum sp. Marseille-Q0166 TaxID=2761105 RepID=UPI0016554B0B|nr:heme exporter protein CcmD [Ochrobactrum sp. Marseille-Q0166]MBC8716143.1 heme exporter protein CcmD [Ochrobactrum sp. Marseille-Q0166]